MGPQLAPSTLRSVLVLVTKDDCAYCGRAHEVLQALGADAREVDVGSREAADLAARGIPLAFLPVLTDGERVLAYGRFSEKRLRKELAWATS
jgi:glutaredoxin